MWDRTCKMSILPPHRISYDWLTQVGLNPVHPVLSHLYLSCSLPYV
jgi:hypothetical protein